MSFFYPSLTVFLLRSPELWQDGGGGAPGPGVGFPLRQDHLARQHDRHDRTRQVPRHQTGHYLTHLTHSQFAVVAM